MASAPPLVDYAFLIPSDGSEDAIPVGSPAWYAWLASSTSFAFRGAHGTFTAHKEHRTPTQVYWKAYRRRSGRLHRAYLGKSHELTLDRLNAIASQLAGDTSAPTLRSSHEPATGQAPTIVGDAMSSHLLATKFALPPPRAGLVPRLRLAALFQAAIAQRHRLILVAAPAGFGKTTAVGEWLHGASDCSVAWLALDDADNQLDLFLAYLIAALGRAHPHVGAEAWALLRGQAARPATQAILISLINALASSGTAIILALDDYHLITLPAIHEAIAFLLDRMPAHMHIVITTRADPPLPLGRLRARGQLAEVRAADLRFTREEAIYLFEQIHQVVLSPSAVTMLEARTEGWAAGLQLAALSLQQQDATRISALLEEFSGNHTYVFDYLAEEVFQTQPEHLRRFLLQTTILDRLCGPLCAAVTGQGDAPAELIQVDQANLFLLPLDTSRRWYRYHPLFRDFLRAHSERTIGAAERAQLYRRASAWFEQEGLAGEAIDYALQAEAWGDALRCLSPLMASERLYEHYLDWLRWLAGLPDAVLQQHPDVCLRLAWIVTFIGHAEAADRPLNLAEAIWQVAGNQAKVGEVLCWRAVALFYRRDVPNAIQAGQRALALLPAEMLEARAIASLVVGLCELEGGHAISAMQSLILAHATLQHSSEIFYSFAASFGLARAYQIQGQLRHAAALYQGLIERGGSASQQEGPAPYIHLGMLFYEWNNLAAADQTLREGIAVGQRTGRGRYWPRIYTTLARVAWARGDAAQAQAMIEQSLSLSQLLDSPRDIADAQAQQARLWLAQGDLPAAVRWQASRAHAVLDQNSTMRHLSENLMLARVRIAQARQAPGSADLGAVVYLLNRLLGAAEADGRMCDVVEVLVLTTLAYAAQQNGEDAEAMLGRALALAEPEGYIRTFVDEGSPLRTLLTAQRARLSASGMAKRQRVYVERLLEAFPQDALPASAASPTAEPLSERERTVLQLLADGRSIQEIATLLVISPSTARTHVRHIYAKLDVHNRIQALERARSLRLL